jgi:hypothetical protein
MVSACSLASRTRSSTVPVKDVLAASLGRLQVPALGRKKRLGIGAVGQDLEPALDAPGIGDAPDFDGIRGQFRGFESRQTDMPDGLLGGCGGGRSLAGGLLEQALHRGRRLRADAAPVGQAVLRDAQLFLVVLGDRVVEPRRSMKRPSRRTRLSATTML